MNVLDEIKNKQTNIFSPFTRRSAGEPYADPGGSTAGGGPARDGRVARGDV